MVEISLLSVSTMRQSLDRPLAD